MKQYGTVRSTKQPEPRQIDDFSVWVVDGIKPVSEPGIGDEAGFEGYEYTLTQYDKDEYIGMIDEKNTSLEAEVTSTQMALCEVYELLG